MTARRIHIIGLEAIETRYTKEWKDHIPSVLHDAGFEVFDGYYGEILEAGVGTSDFLNWTSTNYFKSSQMMRFAEAVGRGDVRDDDIILVADFWNPAVIMIRYILGMAGIKAKLAGIAHAGAYDPQDRLAERLGDEPWVMHSEYAMFSCYDAIFFATSYHQKLFQRTHGRLGTEHIAGFPMEYVECWIDSSDHFKRDLIVFAQRNAPEKQPHLFAELANWATAQGLPYEFVDVGAMGLKKHEYHQYLREAKLVVSFALQETLGITPFEALSHGCDVLVPNRLSYAEMYDLDFIYETDESGAGDLDAVKALLVDRIENFESRKTSIVSQYNDLAETFFSSAHMVEILKEI